MENGQPSQLLVGISAIGYPVSDIRTLNYKVIVPSHLWWVTPFALKRYTAPTEIPNCLIDKPTLSNIIKCVLIHHPL